jgi:hypothetical protein
MQRAALKVRREYDKSVRGFYGNAQANLDFHTRKLFDYGTEGDDMLDNIKSYV